jgi:hypothetical protein
MTELIALQEVKNRMQVFNLPHEVFCKARKACVCKQEYHERIKEDLAKGERWRKRERIRICKSVTLMPRGYSEPLPSEVLECPEIKSAIDRQYVRVKKWDEIKT